MVLDLAGRWGLEHVPQRRPLTVGTHLREGRHGCTGADAALVMVAGAHGFGFAAGEVWGVHVAWSGNHRTSAERLRARPSHSRTARPVVMNVWEAVYFDHDHDHDRLRTLADRGAEVGVERYVLDDGWSRGRRDDTAGLGDWFVDEDVWPDGLGPLVDHVHGLGLEFGLWFEPEMVSPDSDLACAHPDWILQVRGRLPVLQRHQQVLDVAYLEAFAYLQSGSSRSSASTASTTSSGTTTVTSSRPARPGPGGPGCTSRRWPCTGSST